MMKQVPILKVNRNQLLLLNQKGKKNWGFALSNFKGMLNLHFVIYLQNALHNIYSHMYAYFGTISLYQ